MQTHLRIVTALSVLGATAGCNVRHVPLLTADRLTTVAPARSVDALWMIALPPSDDTVRVSLSEWKVELSRRQVSSGTVVFRVRNKGTMPHAFEIEGAGIERETPPIPAGADTVIALGVHEGRYEIYCPIGEGTAYAHKSMGMMSALNVGGPGASSSSQLHEQ